MMVSLFFLIIVSIAVSMGRTIEKKKVEPEKEVSVRLAARFSEEQVNDFLNSFFSFKSYGDNYQEYEAFLTKKAKVNEETRLGNGETFPQFFGNSTFVKSENYTRIINEWHIEVICEVLRTIDLFNQEGKIVTKQMDKEVMLKLLYTFDDQTETFLIDSYEKVALAEQ